VSPRLWIWWLWRRVRLVVARLLGRDGEARTRGGAPIDADPLGALKGELLSAAERLEEDERLGIPRVGVDYEPVEMTPALEARRDEVLGELRAYQGRRGMHQRRFRRARRRVRLATAGVAVALLLVAVAGTSALGLGVPLFDQALEVMFPGQDDSTHDTTETQNKASSLSSRLVLRPGPGGKTEPFKFPLPEHDDPAELVAYATPDGGFCTALTSPPRKAGAEPTVGFGCPDPSRLAQDLSQDHVQMSGSQTGEDSVVINGFTSADVEEIKTYSPFGATTTYLSDPATLELSPPLTFRQFVAVIRPSAGDPPFSEEEKDDRLTSFDYAFTIRLKDGRELDVAPRP
jgi:hypothetical protein